MTKSTEELAREFDAKFTTDRIDKETAFRFMCQQVDKAKAEARAEGYADGLEAGRDGM